jgi:hypothetical protein
MAHQHSRIVQIAEADDSGSEKELHECKAGIVRGQNHAEKSSEFLCLCIPVRYKN